MTSGSGAPIYEIVDRPLNAEANSVPPEYEDRLPMEAVAHSFMEPDGLVCIDEDLGNYGGKLLVFATLNDEEVKVACPNQKLWLTMPGLTDVNNTAVATQGQDVTAETGSSALSTVDFMRSLGLDIPE